MHPHSVKNHKTNQVFEHFDPTFPIQTRNKTKSNPIRNLLRLPIQTKKRRRRRFTLVSRSLLGDSSSDWLVEVFGNCLSESSRINSTHNKH